MSENKSSSKLDAFELNLKQIQQTNEILNSIEHKLNDVFINQSPSYKRKIDFIHFIGDLNSDKKASPRNNNEDFNENPSFNIENSKNFLNNSSTKLIHGSGKKEKRPKYDGNYDFPLEFNNFPEKNEIVKDENVYHSSIKMAEDYSTNGRSLYSVDLKTKEELDQELRNLNRRLRMLEKENELKSEELKTSRQKIQYLENSISVFKRDKKKGFQDHEDRRKYDEVKETPNIDYSNAKTELLEGRVRELTEENRSLIKERSLILSKLYETEQDLKGKQRAMNLVKAEFEEKLSNLNRSHAETSKKMVEEFKSELSNLHKQLLVLSKENETMEKTQKLLESEKTKLNSSYSNLLSIHNQMLQIDIIKNEKNLQNSFSESNQLSDSTRNSRKIIENLQNYKSEIEKLKANSLASETYSRDLLRLKEEIENQKKENSMLMQEINKIKVEKKVDTPVNSNNNEIQMNKMQEYIKSLELAYKNIETKYLEQVTINQEMKTNWKNVEEKNKDSYDKIEKIYQMFCENENPNIQNPVYEKVIMNSCPMSTKSIVPTTDNKAKSVISLGKTKKNMPNYGSNTSIRPVIAKPKRSNSNSNNNFKKR